MRAIGPRSQLARQPLENQGTWEQGIQPLACRLGLQGRRPEL